MRMILTLRLSLSVVTVAGGLVRPVLGDDLNLWYDRPASVWSEALPLGNGRLGGMVFGGVPTETITINEDTVWSGGPHDYTNVGAHRHLERYRELIRNEQYQAAAQFGAEHMLGVPRTQQTYQTLGNLSLAFPNQAEPQDYRRALNMTDGVVTVAYRIGDTQYQRQVFASHPDQTMVIHLTSDRPGKISFTAEFDSPHKQHSIESCGRDSIVLLGKPGSIRFQSQIQVMCLGGTLSTEAGTLSVSKADSVTILLVAATSFVNYHDVSASPETRCSEYLANALGHSFEELKQRHVADHRALFNRVSLDLGGSDAEAAVPTDQLLRRAQAGQPAPLLEEQLFQFGRYLTIAGARPGTQPLNLVGIWAEGLNAPWGGKWTLNINAQLNTWPVETTGLPECHKPLLSLLEDLRVTGRRVAREHYDCGGFVAHHNTDLWRGAAPVDTAIHGQWTLGGAWLSRHIWEHYDFSRDIGYLRQHYPTLKEAAEFFVDFLVEDQDGYLSTCPAISFEQDFRKPDRTTGRLTFGPTMDSQILRDLFSNCIRASGVLETDQSFAARLERMRSRLRPTRINPKTGHIMEWAFPAEQERISGQTAALWGLSPGSQITPQETPELAAAAVRFLRHIRNRMPHYQNAGSWVTGTQLNEWARLGEAEDAYLTMSRAVKERLQKNLMMHFYTQKYFQIDGNMGTTAGMTEMLLQSHRLDQEGNPVLHLLPALPTAWPTGSVQGLRARGAFTVDVSWENGSLKHAVVHSRKGTSLSLQYRDRTTRMPTATGQAIRFDDPTLSPTHTRGPPPSGGNAEQQSVE